jgi:NADP-dependent 3-hydroxy acid dehydrogenase YdfG
MKNIIVITGASSDFGALAARALAIRWIRMQGGGRVYTKDKGNQYSAQRLNDWKHSAR